MMMKNLVSFDDDLKVYKLTKYQKTNQNTCINLKPIVKKGEKVKAGQVLCEGYATQDGELALEEILKWHSCHGKVTTLRMRS